MATKRYYYGARPDLPDERDHRKVYKESEIPSATHFPTVDIRRYVDHIYDQKALESCTANSLCGAYGLDLKKQSETLAEGYKYFNPSRLFLYYNTRELEGSVESNVGATIRDTIKSLNRLGLCKESDWPYDVSKFTEKPPESCYAAARGNILCKYQRLNQDIDQFRACLKEGSPFVFGFNVYTSFHCAENTAMGKMPVPNPSDPSEKKEGGHAVMAVGYDDAAKHVVVLNSWGEGWGDKGYFYMPYDFIVGNECYDFWKISFVLESSALKTTTTCTTL